MVREARTGKAERGESGSRRRVSVHRSYIPYCLFVRWWRWRPKAVETFPRKRGDKYQFRRAGWFRVDERRNPHRKGGSGPQTLSLAGLATHGTATGPHAMVYDFESSLKIADEHKDAVPKFDTTRKKSGPSAQKSQRRYCVFQSLWRPFSPPPVALPPPPRLSGGDRGLARQQRQRPRQARARIPQPRDFRNRDDFRNREAGCSDRQTFPSRGPARETTNGKPPTATGSTNDETTT